LLFNEINQSLELLISRIGLPSRASRPLTKIIFFSLFKNSTLVKPIGLGLTEDLVLKTPLLGILILPCG